LCEQGTWKRRKVGYTFPVTILRDFMREERGVTI
jgi:hypothetical protein